MSYDDFIIELLTEELPPKSLLKLSTAFKDSVEAQCAQLGLKFGEIKAFAAPRRLALLITQLQVKQEDSQVERKGPALQAAFKDGKPTPAAMGFAKSCGVEVSDLAQTETDKGTWLTFSQQQAGKLAAELMPDVITQALKQLPIAKRMRWGSGDAEFVRPVKNILMMLGSEVIESEILSVKTCGHTFGHRFMSPAKIDIKNPSDYPELLLNTGKVMVDFAMRQSAIVDQVDMIASVTNSQVITPQDLLDEVTSLVEWPRALLVNFDPKFLTVPSEALISAMQEHQKYFAMRDRSGALKSSFITVSNIESQDEEQVTDGNVRVMEARLSDAMFFFETDKKTKLADSLRRLDDVVYQRQLGSVGDKTRRLESLASFVAEQVGCPVGEARRAAQLCKADLLSSMVDEFPDLQGTMGSYYAAHDGESEAVAQAIREHYQPRFSGDALPASMIGSAVAMADRVDTLVGIFGIGQNPTGDKDPYALRRAALGLVRLLVENHCHVDLMSLIQRAADLFGDKLTNADAVTQVFDFVMERSKVWYQQQGISVDVFASVDALNLSELTDIDKRLQAVQSFKELQAAEALAAANKRVSNILAKQSATSLQGIKIDEKLFEHKAESELANIINDKTKAIAPIFESGDYKQVLESLSELRGPIDNFFDSVMVMADDEAVRNNRLVLLMQLRQLFLQVADIACLAAV